VKLVSELAKRWSEYSKNYVSENAGILSIDIQIQFKSWFHFTRRIHRELTMLYQLQVLNNMYRQESHQMFTHLNTDYVVQYFHLK
jgi:hypothetical protein